MGDRALSCLYSFKGDCEEAAAYAGDKCLENFDAPDSWIWGHAAVLILLMQGDPPPVIETVPDKES